MGLFDKKNCSFCGGKVGMLDKKLSNGHICKECRKKLSPGYDLSKSDTKEEIAEQLAYREENYKKLDDLTISDIYGDFGVILVDEEHRKFLALRNTSEGIFKSNLKVSGLDDVRQFNPDIFDFDNVTDIDVHTFVNETEMKKHEGNEKVSYDPPQYEYLCQIDIDMKLDHPYVKSLRIPLVNGSIKIKTEGRRKKTKFKDHMRNFIFDTTVFDYKNNAAFYEYDNAMDLIYHSKYELPDYSFGFKVNMYNHQSIKEYQRYLEMARTICRQLMPEMIGHVE